MIARNKAWAPALAAIAALLVIGTLEMTRADRTVMGMEADAIAFDHAVEELEQLVSLGASLARLRESPAFPSTESEREMLIAALHRIGEWRAALAEQASDTPAGRTATGARATGEAVWAYAVARDAATAQSLLLRHPAQFGDFTLRLRHEAEAALPAARVAAVQAAARAQDRRRDLARMAGLWYGGAALGLLLIGVVILRPLSRDWEKRGEKLREYERRMMHGALHDPLTGLPNRRYLTEHASRALAAAARGGRVTAALHLNLDRFKSVNDALGMAIGDKVLRRVATVLRAETRRDDFIARVGADEFVVIVSEVVTLEELVSLATRLLERLAEPMVFEGEELRISGCAGIALAEPDRMGADRLLGNADIALLDAKSSGRNRYAFFTDHRRAEFENRRRIASELREAIAHGQLEPFFQPQVCARTGRALGFEALVRWRHPERGLLTPFHFLDVAQESGLIEQIGEIVTRRALSALAIWRSMGLPAQRIGLNVSAKELRDSAFVDKLAWDVDAAGLEPRNVAVEILESVLIDAEDDPVVRNVAALSSAGFSVELDDFGTGHASIANLKKFRVNKIKIDRSFITDIDTQPEQQKITRAMINLAHSLDVQALVEGVETEAELRRLRAMGCDAVQGYLVGRPMAEAEALAWLRRRAEPAADRWHDEIASRDLLSGGLGV